MKLFRVEGGEGLAVVFNVSVFKIKCLQKLRVVFFLFKERKLNLLLLLVFVMTLGASSVSSSCSRN